MTRETGNHENRQTTSHRNYVIGWGLGLATVLALLIWKVAS